jgi:integrase
MKSILNNIPRRVGIDHLFGKAGFKSWSIGKPVLDARIELKHWTLHDLRRTCASGLANSLRVPPHIIDMALNHAGHRGGVTGTYVRSTYEPEMFAAMAAWSEHIRSLVGEPKPGKRKATRKVVSLDERRARAQA